MTYETFQLLAKIIKFYGEIKKKVVTNIEIEIIHE